MKKYKYDTVAQRSRSELDYFKPGRRTIRVKITYTFDPSKTNYSRKSSRGFMEGLTFEDEAVISSEILSKHKYRLEVIASDLVDVAFAGPEGTISAQGPKFIEIRMIDTTAPIEEVVGLVKVPVEKVMNTTTTLK